MVSRFLFLALLQLALVLGVSPAAVGQSCWPLITVRHPQIYSFHKDGGKKSWIIGAFDQSVSLSAFPDAVISALGRADDVVLETQPFFSAYDIEERWGAKFHKAEIVREDFRGTFLPYAPDRMRSFRRSLVQIKNEVLRRQRDDLPNLGVEVADWAEDHGLDIKFLVKDEQWLGTLYAYSNSSLVSYIADRAKHGSQTRRQEFLEGNDNDFRQRVVTEMRQPKLSHYLNSRVHDTMADLEVFHDSPGNHIFFLDVYQLPFTSGVLSRLKNRGYTIEKITPTQLDKQMKRSQLVNRARSKNLTAN